MEKAQKSGFGIIGIIIIIAVVAVLGGGYWYWQSRTEVPLPSSSDQNSVVAEGDFTGWKTYRNEKYGFEVRYPLEWSLEEVPYWDAKAQKFIPEGTSIISSPLDQPTFTINPLGNPGFGPRSSDDYAENSQVQIGGIVATRIELKDATNNQTYAIIINVPNRRLPDFGFLVRAINTGPQIDEDVINQILSTFKFIN